MKKSEYKVLVTFKKHGDCKLQPPQYTFILEIDNGTQSSTLKKLRTFGYTCRCGYSGFAKKLEVQKQQLGDTTAEQDTTDHKKRVTKATKIAREMVTNDSKRRRRRNKLNDKEDEQSMEGTEKPQAKVARRRNGSSKKATSTSTEQHGQKATRRGKDDNPSQDRPTRRNTVRRKAKREE